MTEDQIREKEELLAALPDGKEKVDEIIDLCNLIKETNSRKLNELSTRALQLSEKINYKLGIAHSHKLLGQSLSYTSDFKKAIEHLDNALLMSRSLGEKKLEANVLLHLGIIYKNFDFKKAVQTYFESLEINKALKDTIAESHVLNNIGIVFKILGNHRVALEYYLSALSLKEKGDNQKTIHNTLSNIGNIYALMEDYEKGLEYGLRALELLRKHDRRNNESVVLGNIGLCYSKLGKTEEAMKYYTEAIEVAQSMGNRKSEADSYGGLGDLYLERGDLNEAKRCVSRGLDIAVEIEDKAALAELYLSISKILLDNHELQPAFDNLNTGLKIAEEINDKNMSGQYYVLLSSYFESIGDHKKAMDYLKLHNQASKELMDRHTDMLTRSLMIQHEAERHQKEAEMNRAKNEELTRIVKKLDEINEDKNNFIGIVSHDLRDPVSSIYSISDIILGDYDSMPEEEKKDFIKDIKTSAQRVINLLQTLLDINAIETGMLKMDFAVNNLTEIIKSQIGFYRDKAKAKRIEIRYTDDKPVLFYGDRHSVEQIFS
ncbi:MAG TPA: tetratricopeptide repeat protein, partial [Ignavibacteria bacterium]|nr:tetratricopeptide repeat protein [Ignavibacteria bacterium]